MSALYYLLTGVVGPKRFLESADMNDQYYWRLGHALRAFSDPPFLKLTDKGIEIEGIGTAVCLPGGFPRGAFNLIIGDSLFSHSGMTWGKLLRVILQIVADRIIDHIED